MTLVGKGVNRSEGRYQERLGISGSRRLAKIYNTIRYRWSPRFATEAHCNHRDELLVCTSSE